jgi:hypothetical protein
MNPKINVEQEFYVVAPYLDEWQWMFVTEYAIELANKGFKVSVVAIEVLNFKGIWNTLKLGTRTSTINYKIFVSLRNRGIGVRFVRVFPRVRLLNQMSDRFTLNEGLNSVIYPHLIDYLGRMQIDPIKDKSVIMYFLKEAEAIQRALRKLPLKGPAGVATPSGRFARNKAVVDYCLQDPKLDIRVLESSSHGHYEVVKDAQSVSEFSELIEKCWSESTDELKSKVGSNFFAKRINQAKSSADEWTHGMSPGLVPQLSESKKLCVFYTSTQIEFEGTGDSPKVDEFQSQVEAIRHLREKLPIEDWELVVRRHPRRVHETHGGRDLLNGIDDIPNINIIDGDSKVDSYALGERADLIFHYGSTIGAEFTFLGKVPVYSLRNSYWWKFAPAHHLAKKSQLRDLDLNNLRIAPCDSVIPWGYYLTCGGIPFKNICEKGNNWTLDGNTIKRNVG